MKTTLLIAETDHEMREAYRMFFKIHNYEAIMTTDGLECLLTMRRVKPAVLLLDTGLRWGGSDGVLEALRTEDPVPWVPVILTTTGEMYRKMSDLVRPPIVRCLRKPFSLKLLLESVRIARAEGQRRTVLAEQQVYHPYFASSANGITAVGALAKR